MRMPILIHHRATIIIEAAPVRHQAVEYVAAIWNGGPAHPECVADARLSLVRRFGSGWRAQKCNQRNDCYRSEQSHRTPRVQFMFAPHLQMYRASLEHTIGSRRRCPYDRCATVDKKEVSKVPRRKRMARLSGATLAHRNGRVDSKAAMFKFRRVVVSSPLLSVRTNHRPGYFFIRAAASQGLASRQTLSGLSTAWGRTA